MRVFRIGFGAAVVFMAGMTAALAQSAAATGTPLDLTTVGNYLIATFVSAAAAAAVWLLKQAVSHLETLTGFQVTVVHGPVIDNAVASAAADLQTKLDAVVDPSLKVSVKSAFLAQAVTTVINLAGPSVTALGLTPDGIAARVTRALNTVAPTPALPVAPPAPPPAPAPSLLAGSTAAAILALLILAPALSACTTAQIQTAETDAKAVITKACADYEAIKPSLALAEIGAAAIPGVGSADAVIEGVQPYVDSFCAAPPSTDAESAAWLATNLGKLQATLPPAN